MTKTIRLLSVIDQTEAQSLYESIISDIDNIAGLEIDASQVERIGTSGIQLLIAIKNYLNKKGMDFKLKAYSGGFEAAFNDLGFATFIQEWKAK
ncbi:MAG: STAS domain-containing protein [Proteobacteria bacterium]|nr:STAS domain-containing protein [Pseudomonadota bacterium]